MIEPMKIVESFPPNYREILDVLGEDKNAVYCYGDTIYNPYKREILPDVHVHERVHQRQQGEFIDVWCYKYLHDKDFRLQSEIEAYGEQYSFIKTLDMSSSLKKWALEDMAKSLSGEGYGNIISLPEAMAKIRLYAKYNSVV